MTRQSTLTAEDYRDFLLEIKFGTGDNLEKCIQEGYNDFKRTIWGIGKFANRDQAKASAFDYVYSTLRALPITDTPTSQDAFDTWHKDACLSLIQIFKRHGWDQFYVGQAQKWFNMALKYIYTFGEDRLPGYQPVYAFCHVPLDNYILKGLRPHGFGGIRGPWSRIDNYEDYFQIQTWIRETFDDIPLDREFRLWQREKANQK